MHTLSKHKIIAELLWWLFTAIILLIVLFPIWDNKIPFPFYPQNALLIILFITFSRYTLFLPISIIAKTKWFKVVIIGMTVLFTWVVSTSVSDFRNFMDEQGLQTLVEHLHVTKQTSLMRYMKNEMVFFGTGSVISCVLLAIRMIVSLWRMRNTGKV
jgi:hypothetical protein